MPILLLLMLFGAGGGYMSAKTQTYQECKKSDFKGPVCSKLKK